MSPNAKACMTHLTAVKMHSLDTYARMVMCEVSLNSQFSRKIFKGASMPIFKQIFKTGGSVLYSGLPDQVTSPPLQEMVFCGYREQR